MVGLQIPISDASGLQIRSNGRGQKPSPLAPWLRRDFYSTEYLEYMEPLAAWASRSGGFVIRQDRVLAFAMRYKNGGITNPSIRCEWIANPLERPRTKAFSIGSLAP